MPSDGDLSKDGTPHAAYADATGSIRQICVEECPIMGETVFFHVPLKTLLLTDLVFTYPNHGLPFGTQFALLVANHTRIKMQIYL